MTGTTTTISISRNRTSRLKLRTAVRARAALIKSWDRYDLAVISPHPASRESGHLSDRGFKGYQHVPDFLDPSRDQFAISGTLGSEHSALRPTRTGRHFRSVP
jgi:hypothetical protein